MAKRHLSPRRVTAVALALPVIFFLQLFWSSTQLSLTWDEPSFIAAGYSYLTGHGYVLNPSHPPLLQVLQALPMIFMDISVPSVPFDDFLNSSNPVRLYGYELLFNSGNDPETIALWARLPVMLLGAALVFAVFFWGRQLYGFAPALLGATMAAFSPNLLAHAKLATEDLGCAFFMFVAVWSFWCCFQRPQANRYILCGVITGLALVAKFTSLLLWPVYLLLGLLTFLPGQKKLTFKEVFSLLSVVACVSALVVTVVYGFKPQLYLEGVTSIYSDLGAERSWYLMGKESSQPWWYYYLAAFVLKTPEPFLILICLAVSSFFFKESKQGSTMFLLVPIAALFTVSCFDQANFGLRRILPVYPFLCLFAARVFVAENLKLKVLGYVLVAWMVMASVSIYPHHLAYFNLLSGGPERAPYLLTDSNIDWGQDLPGLAAWQKDNPQAKPITLRYFGVSPPEAYGVVSNPLRDSDIENPRQGYYAVSANNLTVMHLYQQRTNEKIDWLELYEPLAVIGHSIYIYRFD